MDHRRRLRFDEVLAAAFAREAENHHPMRLDAVAFAQWLSSATINWDTLTLALAHVEHGPGLIGSERYGLAFTARVVIGADARAVDPCIRTNPNRLRLTAIGNAALAMVFPFDGKARPTLLLRSRSAAIRSIGAAALIAPLEIMGAPLGFRDCQAMLVAGGIAPSDATWMMGLRIKEAIHQRYRLEYALKNDTARLRYVEKNPQGAMGGAHNAEAEIRMLRRRLDSNAERHTRLLPELEAMLADMAADWPGDGLSDQQMQWLDNVFVDTAEFRHRLAEKLPHGSNHDWLLRRNIKRLQDFVGLAKPPAEIPTDYFLPHERQYQHLAEWTAQSLGLLYEADKRGVGRRTSDLVFSAAKAATALMEQPFIAARKPEVWQSLLTRAAYAHRFALMVVASMPTIKRDTLTTLNELALKHAFTLLSHRQIPVKGAETFFRLTTLAVQNMRYHSSPDDVREAWSLAEMLPDFARAIALWSSPTLVTKHKALASHLFCRLGALPLSQGAQNLQMTQMLSLLDIAICSCATVGRNDLIADVVSLWDAAYKDWHAINDTWAESAALLACAVAANGPERAQLLADPPFAQSYCVRLIGSLNNTTASL